MQSAIQADFGNAAAALARVPLAGTIDQYLPHDMRSGLEEMRAVVLGRAGLIYQPQVGFVDQVGSLQAARETLPAQMARGNLAQLPIGQVHQTRFCPRLAIAEGAEEAGYL